MAGFAGAYFTLGSVGKFDQVMTAGRGFIALAAMIFGNYMPVGAMIAGLLFGFSDSLAASLAVILIVIIGGRVQTPLATSLGLDTSSLPAAIVLALVVVISALIGFALLSAVADAVRLGLSIEENTRITADLLKGEASLNATSSAPWDTSG